MGLLTRAELASELQVAPRTVQNLEKRGLPVVRVGADPRYDLAEVRRWLGNPVLQILTTYRALPAQQRRWVDIVIASWKGKP